MGYHIGRIELLARQTIIFCCDWQVFGKFIRHCLFVIAAVVQALVLL